MAHIMRKKIYGKVYLYLYESYREAGKVRKRYIRYLGPESILS